MQTALAFSCRLVTSLCAKCCFIYSCFGLGPRLITAGVIASNYLYHEILSALLVYVANNMNALDLPEKQTQISETLLLEGVGVVRTRAFTVTLWFIIFRPYPFRFLCKLSCFLFDKRTICLQSRRRVCLSSIRARILIWYLIFLSLNCLGCWPNEQFPTCIIEMIAWRSLIGVMNGVIEYYKGLLVKLNICR